MTDKQKERQKKKIARLVGRALRFGDRGGALYAKKRETILKAVAAGMQPGQAVQLGDNPEEKFILVENTFDGDGTVGKYCKIERFSLKKLSKKKASAEVEA
jgi:hypothetical protein